MCSTYPEKLIEKLQSERNKYKKWFEMKSKSNAEALVKLQKANLKIEQLEHQLWDKDWIIVNKT